MNVKEVIFFVILVIYAIIACVYIYLLGLNVVQKNYVGILVYTISSIGFLGSIFLISYIFVLLNSINKLSKKEKVTNLDQQIQIEQQQV